MGISSLQELLKMQILLPVAWQLKRVSTDKNFREFYVFKRNNVSHDRLCGLVVRVLGYTMEMYCASCEVRTEFIYVM
jgi:hypothetical protein